MAGANIAFKSISNSYDAAADDSSEYTTDSEVEEDEGKIEGASDPASDWFNSIVLNQPLPPPPAPPQPVEEPQPTLKRGFIAEEAEEPPARKKKVIEAKLAVFHERKGEHGLVKVLVPPGVGVVTISLVQRGLGKHTEHIVVPNNQFHVATVPLGAARDHRDLSISPVSPAIEKSLNVSN